MEVANKFLVGTQGEYLRIMNYKQTQAITKDEALNLAAWLYVMSFKTEEEFKQLVEAVQNS